MEERFRKSALAATLFPFIPDILDSLAVALHQQKTPAGGVFEVEGTAAMRGVPFYLENYAFGRRESVIASSPVPTSNVVTGSGTAAAGSL